MHHLGLLLLQLVLLQLQGLLQELSVRAALERVSHAATHAASEEWRRGAGTVAADRALVFDDGDLGFDPRDGDRGRQVDAAGQSWRASLQGGH